jgi:ssDNA-binding replication factor A large subunit
VQYDEISSLESGQPVRLRAEVLTVSPTKEFTRKDNSVGHVASARISDGSGECRLVLWDDDTQLISSGALKPGIYVRMINGYAKITDFGLEVSKGRFGSVVLE